MALTEEQQIMENKVIQAGYQLKFDVQLHRLKRGLLDKNIYLEKRKVIVSDNKLSMKRDFVDNFTDDMRQFVEDDEEGNPIEKMLTDSEVDTLAEASWQREIDQFDFSIAHNIENIALLDAEIGFRNDGLVERDPTGTTHYVDPLQNGDGSSFDNAWRYLYQFTNYARDGGDVCIVRRVRGGFNPSDEIFINKYSRYKYEPTGADDIETEANFDSVRDVGFQGVSSGTIGKGTIKAWNQGSDNYGHATGRNRSNTPVDHAQKTMIGDSHGRGADQTLYETTGPTPRGIYMDNCTPTSSNYKTDFHGTSRWKDLWTTTNPRDKSRLVHLQHSRWDIFHTTASNRIMPNSSGDMNNPIVVTADFENIWQDFLDTGNADESTPGWGHDGDDTQYTVEVGSKIIRRKKATGDPVEVHSYITPGDWIFVGQLTNDPLRKVDSTYSDDPYEYSYQVRDVNYDKIVLWLPYKGEKAGSDKRLVSMGYAPRMFSNNWQNGYHNADESHNGSKMYSDADTNWLWQGIEWFDSWSEHTSTYYETRNIQLYFNGRCQHKFKDCSFFGQSHGDGHQWYPSSTNWNKRHTTAIIRTNYDSNDIEYEKCVFGNTRYVVYDYYNSDSYHYQSSMKFNDCLMNGSIMDNQFANTCVPNDHYTWYYGSSMRTSHRYPMSVLYSRRNDYYEFNDCEMVNWKYQIFKVMPQTELKCRGVKFLGTGLDFVDPMATNDADAQENLGLRYSRALFAGDPGIHPITQGASKVNNHLGTGDATGGWTYDMIYPGADAKATGPNTNNKVIETSSASANFGKFRNATWANMGSKWFVYTSSDLTIGTNTNGATSTGGTSVGSSSHTRLDSARSYRDSAKWRTEASSNSAGAYGYSTQPTNATGGREPIGNNNNESQTYGSDPEGYNDNQMNQPYNGHWDGSSSMSDWENMLAFNGALSIIGAKGFDDKGALVWDWDQYWRSGDGVVHSNAGTGSGGSWALRTTETTTASPNGIVRYPHVYGGVRIPPSISELLGRFFCWYPFFRATPWSNEGCYKNNWPSYHSNNDSGSDTNERSSNNTTLAPKNSGADDRSNDGAIWDTDYTNSNNSYDWQLSNGCGFGIGSAPMHGVVTIYDHQNGEDKNRPINQNFKKTSQDHYQLFLNYDYNQYKDKGYFTSDYEQFQDKPLLTGVGGIGKGIIWQQGRMDHWDVTPSLTGMGASKTVGYRVDSNAGDPQFRGTGYQWMTPIMETVVDNDLIQSGGGNYLIKVYPPWMLGKGMELPNPFSPGTTTTDISNNYQRQWREQNSLKIFEYPFYLSQNSRTYTVNIRPDPGTATEFTWLANPTGSDIYLEMEFFDTDATTDRLQQSRKLKRSNSGVDMGTNAWSQLSVTVTPKSEGVGYLRLWYAKPRETGKVNVFYVDPKVVVY